MKRRMKRSWDKKRRRSRMGRKQGNKNKGYHGRESG
jgi:hypothetical protein